MFDRVPTHKSRSQAKGSSKISYQKCVSNMDSWNTPCMLFKITDKSHACYCYCYKASNFNNRTVMSFVFAQWHCYKRTLNFVLPVKKNMASSISFVACFLLSATMWSVEGQSRVKLDPELFAPCVNIGYAHTLPLPSYVDYDGREGSLSNTSL